MADIIILLTITIFGIVILERLNQIENKIKDLKK